MRPTLHPQLDSHTFRQFYYLKKELVDFCRETGLPISGSKRDLNERIVTFLETGAVNHVKSKKSTNSTLITSLSEESVIEKDIICSELHRKFFKEKIGSRFTFNVPFQKWLKQNSGKTYGDAIAAYYKIMEEKKHKKLPIDPQFEYNTYLRDFFNSNPDKNLSEAIKCWKYKKMLPGSNRYESSDLRTLPGL